MGSYHPAISFLGIIAEHPTSLKLGNMKAALSAGADPNEMDHERDPRRSLGRPLHCAIRDWGNPNYIKENIPAIKLLLEHGADPRLSGSEVKPASLGLQLPLECARRLAMGEWRGMDELLVCGYYAEAYRVMKEAAEDWIEGCDAAMKGRGFVDSVLNLFGVR